jgi:hypothetical protein
MSKYETFGKGYVSYSSLKELLKSPLHFVEYMTKEKKEPTDAMNEGSLFDCLLFTPDDFEDRFFVFDPDQRPDPDKTFGATVNREWKALQYEIAGDKTVVSVEQMIQTEGMIEAIENSDAAEYFFGGCDYQVKVEGEIEGVPLLGYVDSYSRMLSFAGDLKTTAEDVSKFIWASRQYKYALQAFIYKTLLGVKDFKFIVVTKSAPYTIGVYDCTDDFINKGADMFFQARERLDFFFRTDKECPSPNKFTYFDSLY